LIFILRFKETESSLENTYVRLNPTQYDLQHSTTQHKIG
jgi:hypothetical protein